MTSQHVQKLTKGVQAIRKDVAVFSISTSSDIMSGTLGPIPQPFEVDVLPSGFSDLKDRWNVALGICTMAIAFLTMIFTFSIPVVLWMYDKRQEQRQQQLLEEQNRQQQQLAAQQRLQGHVSQLSGAGGTAMGVISSFKDDCESLGLSYAEVFRRRELIPGQAAAATRQQLHEVDQARRRLQGIWDNIMDDYRAGLLGGSIRDRQHGRMLRRGLAYMKLVEPLEAANFTRMQELYAVAPEGICQPAWLSLAWYSPCTTLAGPASSAMWSCNIHPVIAKLGTVYSLKLQFRGKGGRCPAHIANEVKASQRGSAPPIRRGRWHCRWPAERLGFVQRVACSALHQPACWHIMYTGG